MISIQTPSGKKGLIFRGIRTADGNKSIAAGSILTTDDDIVFWDGSLAALEVSASPPSVAGGVATHVPTVVGTNSTTATATGGTPPYTYAWGLVDDGGFFGWGISTPASRSTYFTAVDVSPGENFNGTFQCVATDARGATGTVNVVASVANYGGF